MEIRHYVEIRLWANEFVGLGPRKAEKHAPPPNEEVCERPLKASWQRVVWASFVEMMMRPAPPNGGAECSSTVSIIGHLCNSFDPDGHVGGKVCVLLWIIHNFRQAKKTNPHEEV